MSVYHNCWDCWTDVSASFAEGYRDENPMPEPEEVIYADYDIDGYDGSAFVVYREGDKFFTVSGGHCSCYGLEGQWKPEEYPSLDAIIACLSKGSWGPEQRALSALKALRTPTPAASVPATGGFTVH